MYRTRILSVLRAVARSRGLSSTAQGAKELSPAVRGLIDANKLVASDITATGPKGHILKGDVIRALAGMCLYKF